jgi:hypothetical protein
MLAPLTAAADGHWPINVPSGVANTAPFAKYHTVVADLLYSGPGAYLILLILFMGVAFGALATGKVEKMLIFFVTVIVLFLGYPMLVQLYVSALR